MIIRALILRSVWILFPLVTLLFPPSLFANTGVFFGSGSQVIPIKNGSIQLVSERVSIKLRIDEKPGMAGLPFLPRADVTAEFVLKNSAASKVELQVGFPFLDLQGFGDERFVLSKLDFQAREGVVDREVSLKTGVIEEKLDPQGLFKKVFVWNETFKGSETKTITITYKLLLSAASANSNGRNMGDGKYRQLDKLFPAIDYRFHYITDTAYTWKGPVKSAVFTLDCTELFERFNKEDFRQHSNYTLSRPVVLSKVLPGSAMRRDNTYRWEFKQKVPSGGIIASFTILYIPSLPREVDEYIEKKVATLSEELSKEEYLSVLQGYYARVVKRELHDKDTLIQDYFEPVHLLKGELVFPEDRARLGVILDKITAHARGERDESRKR